MEFKTLFDTYNWGDVEKSIYAKTSRDVEVALSKDKCDLEDFKALISPAAVPYLETMAQKSHERTLRRFGNTMQLYVPLYLSNICYNSCVYCGFNHKNKINRRILNDEEILREAEAQELLAFRAAVERAAGDGSDAGSGEHVHGRLARGGEAQPAAVREDVVGALGDDGLEARLAQGGADAVPQRARRTRVRLEQREPDGRAPAARRDWTYPMFHNGLIDNASRRARLAGDGRTTLVARRRPCRSRNCSSSCSLLRPRPWRARPPSWWTSVGFVSTSCADSSHA